MKLGLDVFLEKNIQQYRGKRIGLVTNMTGVNRQLVPTIDLFYQHPDVHLTALFGPEHGIRGDAKEGEEIASTTDPYTGLPVYSLYGKTKKPTPDMLNNVDVLFIDLQDVGARYYTYIYTMANVMETCGEHGLPFVVLDRPNPIGGLALEGNLVKDDCKSFVGLYPLPNRHGLTIGEIALLYQHEFGLSRDVTVIPMEGWSRDMYFEQTGLCWVPPSPNSSGIDMSILYPGTCLVEGTNLSEGRGTIRPFEYIGAPYIDGFRLAKEFNNRNLGGVIARPISFVPTYQKYNGERCEGVQIHIVNRQKIEAVRIGLTLLETISDLYLEDFAFREASDNALSFFDLLAGDRDVQKHVQNHTVEQYLEACLPQLEAFKKQVTPYLLYQKSRMMI